MKRLLTSSLSMLFGVIGLTSAVDAQVDPYLGQLMLVGFTYCPRGWTEADGQLLSIASNTALFSLYGTTYGGNGQTTFALPDLRGRVAMHTGTGPGLPPVVQGEVLGTPTTTLTISNLPAHNHSLNASGSAPSSNDPSGNLLGTFTPTQHVYDPGAPNKVMAPSAIGMTGQNIPFDQHQPSLVLRYCVALQGVFPPRN